jgi:hypothetical protein
MTSSAFLRRELAVATRSLMIAFRINRKVTRLRNGNSADAAQPSALECRESIESRTAEYLAALTRYRVALEDVLARKPEPIAARMGPGGRKATRLHGYEVRWPVSYNSALGRKEATAG